MCFSRAPQQVTDDPLSRCGVASTQCMPVITFKSRLGQWYSTWFWSLEENFLLCRTLVSIICPSQYRSYPMPRHENGGQPIEGIQLASWRWSRDGWSNWLTSGRLFTCADTVIWDFHWRIPGLWFHGSACGRPSISDWKGSGKENIWGLLRENLAQC